MRLRAAAIRLMGRSHLALYRLSGGRVLNRVAGMPVLLLTTTGRRTGRQRTTPLTYFEDGSDLVLIASNGGEDSPPRWWLNLRERPEATVTRRGRAQAVTARAASEEERARLWPRITGVHPGYAAYAARTTRPIPVVMLAVEPLPDTRARTKENAPNR